MDVRFLTDADAANVMLKLITGCDRMAFAVAWAGRNAVASGLLKHALKISHGVIGTHMYQTSPEVLRDFIGSVSVKYMPPAGRLFHPKAYVFWHGSSITAVVGSHNLTASAFEAKNVEASMLLKGTATDQALIDLTRFIDRSWKDGNPIEDDNFLFTYGLRYEINKRKREALETFHAAKRPRDGRTPSPLTLSWPSFVRGVVNEKNNLMDARLSVLERARRLFLQRGSFGRMDQYERKAIAATYGSKESQLDDLDWGCFGRMFGQGDFKNLVNESPRALSLALDEIPLRGDVSEKQYTLFAAHFRDAFDGKAHKGGVATASRLLALKRPDWFVAVNNANRDKLCASLGAAPTTLTLDNYWPSIVLPITMSTWWNHPRPSVKSEARIWDNRAAMLDSHFYVPM